MRVPGVKAIRRSLRRARSRLLGGVAILGYHRVGEGEDPLGLAVSSRRFIAQVEILARKARPIPLSEAVRTLGDGTLPRRAVVMTFDDGYLDTLEVALPVIERLGVPATVFVSTGWLGREFWWDELTRLFAEAPRLPPTLDLELEGRRRTWRLTESGCSGASRAARRAVLATLAGELRSLRASELEDALRAVRLWAAQPNGNGPGPRRALSVTDVQQLATSPFIEIGAHTVSHPVLPLLSRREQLDEVHQSRIDLENIIAKPVTSFSYPHGAYSAETVSAVEEAGFLRACCSEPSVATRGCHPLRLPRLWVTERDGASFSSWLDAWLHA